MKTRISFIAMAICCLLNCQVLFGQSVDIGLFESADNMLEVRLNPHQDFDGIVSNVLFTVRWSADKNYSFGNIFQDQAVVSYIPILKSGDVVQDGDFKYQVFFGTGMLSMSNIAQNWTANSELVLMRIPVNTNQGVFEIVEDSWTAKEESNANFFCSLGGKNATGAIYNSRVDFCKDLALSHLHNTPTCYGNTDAEIDLSITGGNAPFDIAWSNGDRFEDLAGLPAGTYFVDVTDRRGCVSAAEIVIPEAEFVIPDLQQSGDELYTELPGTYQWYLNNDPIPGATSARHVISKDGSYQLELTNDKGCVFRSEFLYMVVSGQNEPGLTYSIKIYPNPSDGLFAVVFSTPHIDDYYIELTNGLGQVVKTDELKQFSGKYENEYDLRDMGKGLYSIKIVGKSQQATYKIVIE